jgi:hypothetical protein
MLPSTQQIFQLSLLLQHVSVIHDDHQAGIHIVIEIPIRTLIGATRRIEYQHKNSASDWSIVKIAST